MSGVILNLSMINKICSLLLSIVVFFALALPVLASGDAGFTLSPNVISVKTGESFTVVAKLATNGEQIDTARLRLNFPAALLEVTGFDLGTLFSAESPGNSISNLSGTLSQGAVKYGERVSVDGDFAEITFRAFSPGVATISLDPTTRLINNGYSVFNNITRIVTVNITGNALNPTEPRVTSPLSGEPRALVYFGALVGRLPASALDWSVIHCMAYDNCYSVDNRDIEQERAALKIFTNKYGHLPSDGFEWQVIHAIAYTDIILP